jgi:hypothetical protein
MLKQSAGTQDIPAPITPEIRPRMPWRVVEAAPLDGFRFSVRFVDGTTGTVDLAGLIRSPHAGVFARLADPALFAQVFVEHGVVTWPGELDLAPDAMYAEIKKSGEWKLR